jgi:hypothetical protein
METSLPPAGLGPVSYDNQTTHWMETPENGVMRGIIEAAFTTQTGRLSTSVVAIFLALWVLATVVSPKLGQDEPHLLSPRVPLVGHIYGIMMGQTGYLMGLLYVLLELQAFC